ncbi:FMN-binding negative transcriptional regulator [Flagellimonas sp.]|uniref:FMN-binding negative transcriptional regulator n=1 Tax=Flagellimonas sp. TaxID=2058762 RepID=UPI003B5054CC
MYNLSYHKEHNKQRIKEFIEQFPFAYLSGCDGKNMPVATQLPLLLEERNGKKIIRGHMMKNTGHHKAFVQNENVLVVFAGRHTYVSGTWYSNPHLPSTWNYMSVHAKGVIKFLDDDALIDILRLTTLHFENYNRESTTIFDNVSPEFKNRVMHMIVAFEIEVKEMDTVFKLSQDRDSKSYRNIIAKLKEQSEDQQVIASEMEKRFTEVFPNDTNRTGMDYHPKEVKKIIVADNSDEV